ncbi:MAG: hypothetical protein R3C46_08980 [Hyphomonadaceae bacterium]
MALFPPSTNRDYHGAAASAWFLMLAAVLEFVPGCIHFFLPDGGAGVIAGLDLTHNRETIIAVFAWVGAVQIPTAIMLFVIGLNYRTLVPLGLLVLIIERGLMSIDGWLLKGAAGGHHPPEHYASPVSVVLALVFLALSLRGKSATAG